MNSSLMPSYADHLPLINLARQLRREHENLFVSHSYDGGEEASRVGYLPDSNSKRKPCIVMAGDTAIEFGSPAHLSVPVLLWTKKEVFTENRIWTLKRDLDEVKEGPVSFLMTVMVQIDDKFDPSGQRFKSLLNLSNRIPGYMSRSVPGKMWVRIGRDLIKKNFSLCSLGQCIACSFFESVPDLKGIEIILAAGNDLMAEKFIDIQSREKAISGENKKLALEKDGTLSCEDLDCNSCEYKEDCDTIRDIIRKRK